jgi:hypothetical protein
MSTVRDGRPQGAYRSYCWRCWREEGLRVEVNDGKHPRCDFCRWVRCPQCDACRVDYRCPRVR